MKEKRPNPYDDMKSPIGPHVTGAELIEELESLEWDKQEVERRRKEGMYKEQRKKPKKSKKRSEPDCYWHFGH